jgi:protein-tyrosine-phosphatase
MMHILFVCTGNTCRSPMAEGIARTMIVARGLEAFAVQSAGTSAHPNAPASDGSLLVALEQGIDLSEHRAQELSHDLVHWADVVLTMGIPHRERAEVLGGAGKTYLLTAYSANSAEERPISDPFGGELDVYRATFAELQREIKAVLDRAVKERDQHST